KRVGNSRSRRTLRETNIKNAAGCRIRLTSRSLLSRDLAARLLLRRQDRAAIHDQSFDVALIVVSQNELRVWRDVERTEWSKIHGCGLIGARLDRGACQNRRARVRTQTVNLNRLVVPRRQSRHDLLRNYDWRSCIVWLSESDLNTNLDNREK